MSCNFILRAFFILHSLYTTIQKKCHLYIYVRAFPYPNHFSLKLETIFRVLSPSTIKYSMRFTPTKSVFSAGVSVGGNAVPGSHERSHLHVPFYPEHEMQVTHASRVRSRGADAPTSDHQRIAVGNILDGFHPRKHPVAWLR